MNAVRTRVLRAAAAAGLAVVVALLAVGVWSYRAWTTGPRATPGSAAVSVRVDPGATVAAVADTLGARGLLRHPRIFRWGARLTGQDRDLRAGLYELPPDASPRRLLAIMTAGQTVPVVITLPEGIEVRDAAARLSGLLGFEADTFLAAADSLAASELRRRGWIAPAAAARLDSLAAVSAGAPGPRRFHWSEGYLAPDTYHFAEGSTAREVARTLLSLQLARLDSALAVRPADGELPPLTPHDLVTLGSIVEAESRRSDERARVAAVYANRLRDGWKLDADPTVAYFLAKRGQRLLHVDLARTSPYNTYRTAGLPPGPIGNPGLPALLAAARPDTTCRAYFFVSDGDGGHVFSRTWEEHSAAVKAYRQRRDRRDEAGGAR
ncbi:MAG: endolytic transglycosylase MltG [Candidatus Krumholzibacteriia bacterium]